MGVLRVFWSFWVPEKISFRRRFAKRGLETMIQSGFQTARVAPHAGAWIETSTGSASAPKRPRSRPTRARGLKPAFLDELAILDPVAPRSEERRVGKESA